MYEPQSPSEFLAKSVAAGAEPVYMRSVHDNYADLEAGREPGVAQSFEDFSLLTGKAPRSLRDFIASHVDPVLIGLQLPLSVVSQQSARIP